MPLFVGRTKSRNVGNITDTFGNEAVRIINLPRERPLFLELSFHGTHDLFILTPATTTTPAVPTTLAKELARVDANIGRVIAAASGRGSPLIFFAGDNPRFSNAPFQGKKCKRSKGALLAFFFST